jgi:hypothetical protein
VEEGMQTSTIVGIGLLAVGGAAAVVGGVFGFLGNTQQRSYFDDGTKDNASAGAQNTVIGATVVSVGVAAAVGGIVGLSVAE